MAVFRVEKSKDYTVMSNHHLRNENLSLRAKGLLSQILSLPEDWDYSIAGLAKINKEGKDAVRAAVQELEKAGYIERRQKMDSGGKFSGNEYRRHGYTSGFYCPDDVRKAISLLSPGEELVLEINSIGGSVYDGNEVFSLLEECQNPTRAVIQSLAASAASYMILPCDRIEMHLPAQLMIHRATRGAWGNVDALRQAAQQLDVTDTAILDTYCRRCGDRASREALASMMENETYIGSADALRYGLVDSIVGSENNAQSGLLVASAFNNTVKAMRTLPDIQELLQAEKNESDRLRQELEHEKNKFI